MKIIGLMTYGLEWLFRFYDQSESQRNRYRRLLYFKINGIFLFQGYDMFWRKYVTDGGRDSSPDYGGENWPAARSSLFKT